MPSLKIAVVGAGAIGQAHIRTLDETPGAMLAAIVDPSPVVRELAAQREISWFPDINGLLTADRPDGVIVATPNSLHVPVALDCIRAGISVLVEKPIAETPAQAKVLCETAEAAGVPLLVGHHRRHNPVIRKARELVRGGALGSLVALNVLYTFLKPDSYFGISWRRSEATGGGPILINLIHEIDLIRFICGEIESIQAATSSAQRGFEVEDTAAVLLRLEGGALATLTLSDAASAPWSWDLASGENPSFAHSPVDTHFICGSEGSLTLPRLKLWSYDGARGWAHPIREENVPAKPKNPFQEQLLHFLAVVRRETHPLVTGRDAMRTLEATLAIRDAARTQRSVTLRPHEHSLPINLEPLDIP
jgi:predicted dehydrogenase